MSSQVAGLKVLLVAWDDWTYARLACSWRIRCSWHITASGCYHCSPGSVMNGVLEGAAADIISLVFAFYVRVAAGSVHKLLRAKPCAAACPAYAQLAQALEK